MIICLLHEYFLNENFRKFQMFFIVKKILYVEFWYKFYDKTLKLRLKKIYKNKLYFLILNRRFLNSLRYTERRVILQLTKTSNTSQA